MFPHYQLQIFQKKIKHLTYLGFGAQIKSNGRIIGARTFPGRDGFTTQANIFNQMLEKMKTMEKRYGTMARLDGYQLE